jgi:hypothetical protein
MSTQPDLVDHHRRHRDRVPARPGPLRLELLGRVLSGLTSGSFLVPGSGVLTHGQGTLRVGCLPHASHSGVVFLERGRL